uniref:Retrovirus-related Pol polyprotein from transposon TNT 1-94 n=1 Tax=Tanacetum cinerariifolium TaxID=118510 RepID=A0A6L2J8B6_TANCI|nr:retrovirus-related Pol polyprotein from transposon TNT 1-94 [Tanacetum cinerariifolium]
MVASAAKLPILNPNEFDLWKMRIEKHFLMTDYSLWEVILNGDSPVPTRLVEGVVQLVAPTTAEQKLAKKNELKARGRLLMALPDKHQLKFNSHKDAKTLINKADLEEHSLDDLFNSLKIYEAEVKHSSSTGTTTQNLTLVSSSNTDSTTDSVSDAASVSTICAKMSMSSLPNVDSLSNATDVDDLEEMDLRWQMAMLTMRARRFLQNTGRNLGANGPTSMGFDMPKVECYNFHRKGLFARECRSPKDSRRNGVAEPQRQTVLVETSTSNTLVSQCDGVGSYNWSYQAEEEPANFSLMAFLALSSSSDTERVIVKVDPLVLYDRFQPSGRYHVVPPLTTRTFMLPKPDLVFHTALIAVETDHSAFTIQLSPTKPPQDLSYTNIPTVPIIEDWVSDSEDESKTKAPQIIPSFVQSSKQVKTPRHFVHLIETSIPATTPKSASPKSNSSGKRRNRKAFFVCKSVDHLIKDCDYHAKKMAQPTPRNYAHRVLTQSKPVSITAVRPVSAAVCKIMVTRPRLAHLIVTKSKSPIRQHITRSQSPKISNSPLRVTAIQASVVNAAQGMQGKWGNLKYALKDKSVIDSGCSWHMTGNMSYLFDFEELNGGYVAFGGNLKGGKISGKGKIKTDLLLPIPFWAEAVNTACYVQNRVLVTKPQNKTPYELLHGKTPSIGFMRPFDSPATILNTLESLRKFKGKVDEGFLVGYSVNSKSFIVFNSRTRIVQETLHVNFLENKPNIAGSGPTWLFDIDSLTRTMNYQPVTAGNQTNLSTDATFDGKKHDFDAKKPESEVILSPSSSAQSRKQDDKTKKEAKGKSLVESFIGYIDLSVEFEDCSDNNSNKVNAIELEDITYSDDENDVGAEASFNNLETSITVSPIPTTRIHKDHPVSQIIGDLSSTTQTRSMTRVVKDQGFEDPDHPDKVYKVVKALYGLHQAPRACQDKYVAEILQKFRLTKGKSASTPIDTEKPLLKDPDGEDVDVHTYRSMIGSLMYLTSSRPDIMFAQTVVATSSTEAEYVAAASCCAQVLWIQNQLLDYGHKLLLFRLTNWCCSLGAVSYLKYTLTVNLNIYVSYIKQFWNTVAIKQVNDITRLQALVDKKKVVVTEAAIREEMLVGQEIEEKGNEDKHVEDVTAGDDAQGDDTAAHGEVPTVTQEPSIPSPTLTIPSTSQALEITKLKRRVKRLENGNKARVLKLRRLQRVGTSQRVDTSDDTVMDDESNQGRMIDEIDKDDAVVLMDEKEEDKKVEEAKVDESAQEDEPAKVQQVVDVVTTAKLIIKVVTAASETVTAASAIISAAKPQVLAATITAAPINIAAAPSRRRKRVVIRDPEEESTTSSIISTKNKSKDKGKWIMKKQLKRRKQNEEVEDLKRHLEIMPDEDDDVYTEATLLARKVPVVDYEIIELNNKPYYKIIRADGTHHLYISFLTLLKNFIREDLEALWSLFKERFSTSKPKNFSDDFLLTTLGAIFKKPDAHAQLILLVERRYLLLRFTLDQMLNNVRLQVEEESEVSLEMLRFTRQQHQEGRLE